MTPFAKNIYETVTENVVEQNAAALSGDIGSLRGVMNRILLKIAGLLLVCTVLFSIAMSFFTYFGWRLLFERKKGKGLFWRFFVLNILWFIFWDIIIVATLWMNRNIGGIVLVLIEILLVVYFTRFVHMRFFSTGRLWSSYLGFVDGFRKRSLAWLGIALLAFIVVLAVSALLVSISSRIFGFVVIIIFLMLFSWSQTFLFLLHYGKISRRSSS